MLSTLVEQFEQFHLSIISRQRGSPPYIADKAQTNVRVIVCTLVKLPEFHVLLHVCLSFSVAWDMHFRLSERLSKFDGQQEPASWRHVRGPQHHTSSFILGLFPVWFERFLPKDVITFCVARCSAVAACIANDRMLSFIRAVALRKQEGACLMDQVLV